jgi:hypothetical protein
LRRIERGVKGEKKVGSGDTEEVVGLPGGEGLPLEN